METIRNHIENHVHVLIDDLRSRLLFMTAKTQQAVDNACSALMHYDFNLAERVLEGDEVIDELEVEIDASSLNILARTQPVARDLRFLISAIRLVVDLERIGDEAANISSRLLLMKEHTLPPVYPLLISLAEKAEQMVRESITSFREQNAELASLLRSQQDDATQLVVKNLEYLINSLQKNTLDPWLAMHLILITRALERVCGRAVNVAEHSYFMVEGVNIKHKPIVQDN